MNEVAHKDHVLIVEDEGALRRALVDTFERDGFRTLEAPNGSAGLDIALKERPDVIVTDLLMPAMNGMVFLRKLRAENPYGREVPVVVLTNLSADSEEMNQVITDLHPTYYLVKIDWTPQDVLEKVEDCFR